MQSHLSQERRYAPPAFRGQQGPDRRRQIAHRGIQANAPGRTALQRRFSAIRPTSSIYERRREWDIEEVFRVLKRDGLALEETQVESAQRLFNLAALAIVAAARIIQLTDARDASARPATDVVDESLIEATAAIGETLEGKTARQKNPHPRGSLSWLAWITARLGGWHGYYKPPGPKTMADGWRRLAAILDGYAIAHGKSLV
jgi:hypothetical protein